MNPKATALLLVLTLLPGLSPGALPAAEPELVTDRPDQTESSRVVPPERVQLESGFTFTRNDDDGVLTETGELASSLVRVGVAPRWELRLGWNGYVSEDVETGGQEVQSDGIGDLGLGAKLYVREERGQAPELALIFGSMLPSGASGVSTERLDPVLRLCASHTLSERLGLGYNAGLEWETVEGPAGGQATLSSWTYTLVLGSAITERAGMFVEAFGEIPASADGGPSHSVDGGLTLLLRDNVQLDAAVGLGVSNDADDWFAGLGFSARFPD